MAPGHARWKRWGIRWKNRGSPGNETVCHLKKCDEAEFAEKSALLDKIKAGASSGHYRLVYFDEAGFAASPPVQYGWSPWGKPHQTEPQSHCRRSVLGALNYTDNSLFYQTVTGSITRAGMTNFLDEVVKQGDDRLTFLVLDNARIHHGIDAETRKRWLREYNMVLLYLPAYSPELNLIDIVWKQAKYHWRQFITWTRDTMDNEQVNHVILFINTE